MNPCTVCEQKEKLCQSYLIDGGNLRRIMDKHVDAVLLPQDGEGKEYRGRVVMIIPISIAMLTDAPEGRNYLAKLPSLPVIEGPSRKIHSKPGGKGYPRQ